MLAHIENELENNYAEDYIIIDNDATKFKMEVSCQTVSFISEYIWPFSKLLHHTRPHQIAKQLLKVFGHLLIYTHDARGHTVKF